MGTLPLEPLKGASVGCQPTALFRHEPLRGCCSTACHIPWLSRSWLSLADAPLALDGNKEGQMQKKHMHRDFPAHSGCTICPLAAFFLSMAICGWRFVSFVLPLVARVAAGAAVFSCGCRCWAVALVCDVVLVVSTMVAVCCSFWLMPLSVAPL